MYNISFSLYISLTRVFFGSAGDWNQGSVHDKHMFWYWGIPAAPMKGDKFSEENSTDLNNKQSTQA